MPLLLRRRPPAPPVVAIDDEAEQIARARRDPEAFTPLYLRYVDPIYRYCYRRVGSKELAEDATSRVFVKALAALPTFRGGSFPGWLYRIAHNETSPYGASRRHDPLESAHDFPDEAASPEDEALIAEELRLLRRLLSHLTDDQRRVVELRLAGYTGAEIAELLNTTLAAVKSLQYRAMLTLQEEARAWTERRKMGGDDV